MKKISINEYAKKYQITRQTVYNRIKKGLIETVEEDGVLFVLDEEIKKPKERKTDCQKLIKDLRKQNKKLLKRIEKLESKLDEEKEKSTSILLAYVDEMKALYLPNKRKKKNK